jgi:general secretion pathway protein D
MALRKAFQQFSLENRVSSALIWLSSFCGRRTRVDCSRWRQSNSLAISDAHDLFSIPILLQYDHAVIRIEEVRNGGFLSGGTQEIAIVQRIDQEKGQVIISATRQPNTSGVNGSGTLLGLVIRALAPGASPIQILQVDARDSQQKQIALVSRDASIQVQ